MPRLKFELEKPHLVFEGNAKSDNWYFEIHGKCSPKHNSYKSFTIKSGNNTYNGLGGKAIFYIKKRPERSNLQGIPTDKPFDPNDKYRDYIHITCPESDIESPFFQITVCLPPEAYQRLIDTNWLQQKLILSIENEIMGQALIFGNDPDGRDIEWQVDIATWVFIKEVGLHFLPHHDHDKNKNREQDISNKTNTSIETITANTDRIISKIDELRGGMIKAVYLLGAALLIATFIK